MRHGVFEGCGIVVCRVEFDADAEIGGDDFADLGEDFEDDSGSFLGCASVSVCAVICLSCINCCC